MQRISDPNAFSASKGVGWSPASIPKVSARSPFSNASVQSRMAFGCVSVLSQRVGCQKHVLGTDCGPEAVVGPEPSSRVEVDFGAREDLYSRYAALARFHRPLGAVVGDGIFFGSMASPASCSESSPKRSGMELVCWLCMSRRRARRPRSAFFDRKALHTSQSCSLCSRNKHRLHTSCESLRAYFARHCSISCAAQRRG